MAIYASRGAGKGMLATETALSVVAVDRSLRELFPAVPDYFGRCAANPESLWPMPDPDPAHSV